MSVSTPVIYRGMYVGDMDEKRIKAIIEVENSKCIENLRRMIYNFPMELVQRSIDEGTSIRRIIKEENIDCSQYIGEMRDYQTVGTAFMYLSPRSIIGDAVGLGKTVEIAGLINFLKAKNEIGRFLMVVENSAISQTVAELMRFTGLRVIYLPSDKLHMQKFIEKMDWRTVDGIVTKHSTLRSDYFSTWVSLNIGVDGTFNLFDTLFLDESSVIKNQKTKVYTYAENICNLCKRVHMLNATTFETNIMDIYNQVDMMNPMLLPRKYRIEQEFCTFGSKPFWKKEGGKAVMKFARELTGYKNQELFKARLRVVYFARSKADVGLETGNNKYRVVRVYPTVNQKIAMANGERYSEVLNCPSLIPSMQVTNSRETVPKMDEMLRMIENEYMEDKIMIYCFHIEAQYSIAKELIKIGRKPVVLNGECSDEERKAAQQGFNGDEYDVIITNIKKSLNLDSGTVCFFYSVETSPARLFQIAGRIDRNTTDKAKTFILMMYADTDEYKFFITVVKQRAQDARDLTIDAKTTVDFFIDTMREQGLVQ